MITQKKRYRIHYASPTPVMFRKIGDALLAASAMGGATTFGAHPQIALGIFIAGMLGKFITSLFAEEKKE